MCKISHSLIQGFKTRLLVLFVLSTGALSAQTSLVNFDSPLHLFKGFNGCVSSISVDPQNASNNVGKIINNGDIWEGAGLKLPVDVYLDSVKVITIKFYQSDTSSTTIIMKMVDQFRTPVEVLKTVNATGWTTLSYDFSQALVSGTNTSVNADGGFSRIELFINGGTSKTGTYYIDDLEYPNYESANSIDVIYTGQAFADEFNYFGPIDTSMWFPEVVPPNSWGWFNGEQQHYTNRTDNVFVSNGTLKIVAKKESFSAYGLTLNYTSARLNSKFDFKYGRIDVRAKLPEGDGTWPAIWMLGKSYGNNWNPTTKPWPDCGEIDIMEHWGNDPNEIHGSLHTLSSNGATVNTQRVIDEDVFNDWHVYSVNWSPNQISFLMDGFLYYTYNPSMKDATTWPFDDPQFILLNVAMGGIYPINPNFTEATMEIDYLRVYQNNINIGENNLASSVAVYPNPTADYVFLDVEESGTFILYDLLGKEVMKQPIDGIVKLKIELPELASGTYVWQFKSGAKSASGKIQITNP